MKGSLIFVLFIFFASSSYAVDKFQAALDKARIDNKVSAMQMTIFFSDKIPKTFVSGTTTKIKAAPAITPDTLFQIGSDTKSFTVAVLLKLEVEGKLKLTDTLNQYFPQYKKWRNVKITQMLHNSSGIPNFSEDKNFQKKILNHPEYVWTPAELVAIAAKRTMDFKPDNGWHYSNTNFILAGMIAEKVTNKSLKTLYQEYFLDKSALNLQNTYYITDKYPPNILNRMAHGYTYKNRDITADNLSWGGAAGAMISNSTDLANWAYDLFHGKVLPKSALQQMMSVVSTKTGKLEPYAKEGYGLGIGTRIDAKYGKWWGHEGETLGYHAMFIWYPAYDMTAAILTNGEARHLREFAASLPGLLENKTE